MLGEHRERRSINPYLNLESLVTFDADGNVLCGSEIAAVGKRPLRSLAKLSISDGAELWQWTTESFGDGAPSTGYGHLAQPAGLSRGHIWVSGIRWLAERKYERFLALLDGKDGKQQWQISLNVADDAFDRPAEVYTLSGSDAIVMSPPRYHEKSYPWRTIRLDSITTYPAAGGLEGKNDYPRVFTATPSGRIITSGDSAEKGVVWRIQAW
jgi:hypothetical protein